MVTRFTLDLEIYRGDTFSQTLRIKDKVTGAPVDLSGWTWRAQIRVTPDATTPEAEFTVDATQSALGELTLSLTSTVTTTLDPGVWDLEGVQGAETKTRGGGQIAVRKDVTR